MRVSQRGDRGKVAEADADAEADGKTDPAPSLNTNTTYPSSANGLLLRFRPVGHTVKHNLLSLSTQYSKKFNRFQGSRSTLPDFIHITLSRFGRVGLGRLDSPDPAKVGWIH